jgi:hypothetical protein
MIADDYASIARGMKKRDTVTDDTMIICPHCEHRMFNSVRLDVCTQCNTALKRTEPYLDGLRMSDISRIEKDIARIENRIFNISPGASVEPGSPISISGSGGGAGGYVRRPYYDTYVQKKKEK